MTESKKILEIEDVEVLYEGIIVALAGVSWSVAEGEIVALLGANGAGKSTTLQAVSGLLGAKRGAVTGGRIRFRGEDIAGKSVRDLVRAGVVQVLEGRHCFPHLSVVENLVSGTLGTRGWFDARRADTAAGIERVFKLFPRLAERRRSAAGLLSGGEQQMLAIGRALLAEPRVLLLDEPSMGLAPKIVAEIFDRLAELNERDGVTIVLAEQNARVALRYAHSAVVVESGRVVSSGAARELRERDDVKKFYLGHGHAQRRDSRTVSAP